MRVTHWKDLPVTTDPESDDEDDEDTTNLDVGNTNNNSVIEVSREEYTYNSEEDSVEDSDTEIDLESADDSDDESGEECEGESPDGGENIQDVSSPVANNTDNGSDYHKFDSFLDDHPECETAKVRVVAERDALVPDFIGGVLPRRDKGNREEYCITMLTLFKPWRSGLDLKNGSQSWEDAFNAYVFSSRQQDIMNNFNLRYECRDARDDFAKQRKGRGFGSSEFPMDIDEDEMDQMNGKFSRAVDLNTTEYDEEGESWEDQVKRNNSSVKQIERMVEAENMLEQNGLVGEDHSTNFDIA